MAASLRSTRPVAKAVLPNRMGRIVYRRSECILTVNVRAGTLFVTRRTSFSLHTVVGSSVAHLAADTEQMRKGNGHVPKMCCGARRRSRRNGLQRESAGRRYRGRPCLCKSSHLSLAREKRYLQASNPDSDRKCFEHARARVTIGTSEATACRNKPGIRFCHRLRAASTISRSALTT